jgi:hypothetical protein
MLKTVSSIVNAIGALNYKGAWDANLNIPTLVSSVGNKGDYYVVSVAGTTNLNGINLWSIGDWAVFNGSVWQKINGSTTEAFVNISVSGVANIATGNITNLASGNVAITGGSINVQTTQLTATTASTATFGTSSLPLVPLGYLEFDLNGTVVKVPYYAV